MDTNTKMDQINLYYLSYLDVENTNVKKSKLLHDIESSGFLNDDPRLEQFYNYKGKLLCYDNEFPSINEFVKSRYSAASDGYIEVAIKIVFKIPTIKAWKYVSTGV